MPEARLTPLFETLWPTLETKVSAVPKTQTPPKQNRPQHEILEELVSSIRGLDMRFRETVEEIPRRRRKHRYHPMMLMEMTHGLKLGPRDPIGILLLASVVRDDLPWLYELGMDAYRALINSSGPKAKDARHRFVEALKMTRRGPFMEEISDKETYMVVREMEHWLERSLIDTEPEARTKKKGDDTEQIELK